MHRALLQRFCYKKHIENGFHGTICLVSVKIFINAFASLYVTANLRKPVEKKIIFLRSLFRKILMSAFLLRFKANYLEKMRATPIFLCKFQPLQISTFSEWS